MLPALYISELEQFLSVHLQVNIWRVLRKPSSGSGSDPLCDLFILQLALGSSYIMTFSVVAAKNATLPITLLRCMLGLATEELRAELAVRANLMSDRLNDLRRYGLATGGGSQFRPSKVEFFLEYIQVPTYTRFTAWSRIMSVATVLGLISPATCFLVHILIFRIFPGTKDLSRQKMTILVVLIAVGIHETVALALTHEFVGIAHAGIISLLFGYTYFHWFNMSETARRISVLVHFVAKQANPEQNNYNPETIFWNRIQRMKEMGTLIEKHGRLYIRAVLCCSPLRPLFSGENCSFLKDLKLVCLSMHGCDQMTFISGRMQLTSSSAALTAPDSD